MLKRGDFFISKWLSSCPEGFTKVDVYKSRIVDNVVETSSSSFFSSSTQSLRLEWKNGRSDRFCFFIKVVRMKFFCMVVEIRVGWTEWSHNVRVVFFPQHHPGRRHESFLYFEEKKNFTDMIFTDIPKVDISICEIKRKYFSKELSKIGH